MSSRLSVQTVRRWRAPRKQVTTTQGHVCATVEVCEQTLKPGEVRLGLNMGDKEDGEARAAMGKQAQAARVQWSLCPPFFAFVLVWSFTTSHINVNWYSVPFLNFFNFFFLLNNSTSNLLHLTIDFQPVHMRTCFILDMRYALSSAFSIFIHPPLKSYLPVTAYF